MRVDDSYSKRQWREEKLNSWVTKSSKNIVPWRTGETVLNGKHINTRYLCNKKKSVQHICVCDIRVLILCSQSGRSQNKSSRVVFTFWLCVWFCFQTKRDGSVFRMFRRIRVAVYRWSDGTVRITELIKK